MLLTRILFGGILLTFAQVAMAQKSTASVEFYNKAVEYYNSKNYELAAANYTSSINVDVTNADAFYHRGNCYISLKQYHKAVEDFEIVISV